MSTNLECVCYHEIEEVKAFHVKAKKKTLLEYSCSVKPVVDNCERNNFLVEPDASSLHRIQRQLCPGILHIFCHSQ